MQPNSVVRMSLGVLISVTALFAQVARRETMIPLKNWASPLYWQPNPAEREAARQASPQRAEPQLVFSASAVSTNALTFVAITPCRLVDTRGAAAGFNGIEPFSGPSIQPLGTLTVPVQSATEASTNTTPAPCGAIPSIAQAYSLNLTVVPQGPVGYISLWPTGSPQPVVSTLNDTQGEVVANAAIVPAGTPSGGVSVYNAGPAIADVIIDMNGFYAAPTDLNGNTAIGAGTLLSNTTGTDNTAVGNSALTSNTTGVNNTATGNLALASNTTGCCNTASGNTALTSNTTGSSNTASGGGALYSNTTGSNNSAFGRLALNTNTIGANNTAVGENALLNNTTGVNNVAVGQNALNANTTGNGNSALGAGALSANTGTQNAAIGTGALTANVGGSANVAIGWGALGADAGGNNNIAIGNLAAHNLTGNMNNIHIGSQGTSGDSGVIRIGTVGTQTSTYIAGVYSGSPGTPNLYVCVDANGTLGTTGCSTPSSRRFKDEIADMGDATNMLLRLRPVTFFYKPQYDDGSHSLQYGLVAEEVAKVYPDMVGYDKNGQPSSIKYQSLAPMLLNEVQKQNREIQSQELQIRKQAEALQVQQEQNHNLADRLAALELLLSGQAPKATGPVSSQ
jgi:hypothetical protein